MASYFHFNYYLFISWLFSISLSSRVKDFFPRRCLFIYSVDETQPLKRSPTRDSVRALALERERELACLWKNPQERLWHWSLTTLWHLSLTTSLPRLVRQSLLSDLPSSSASLLLLPLSAPSLSLPLSLSPSCLRMRCGSLFHCVSGFLLACRFRILIFLILAWSWLLTLD